MLFPPYWLNALWLSWVGLIARWLICGLSISFLATLLLDPALHA